MTCGIYKLDFAGVPYIGKSNNIELRYQTHLYKLKKGIHTSKLQDGYLKHGTPTLEILLICNENNLHMYEIICANLFNCVKNGYNTAIPSIGGSSMPGEDNPNSKYSNEDIEEVFHYIVYNKKLSSLDIRDITGVAKTTVDAIRSGKLHKRHLSTKYPEDYKNMILDKLDTSKCGKGKTAKERGIIYPPIISPTVIIHNVENTSQFAKDHGLNNAHLVQVLKGQEKQHKGWKIHK